MTGPFYVYCAMTRRPFGTGSARCFATFQDAEQSARRALARHGDPVDIVLNGGARVACVSIDALGRRWTDLTSTGCTLV